MEQTKGLYRDDRLDKFYTNKDVAKECVYQVAKYVRPGDIIIEPSAGNGVFIEPIMEISGTAFFYDIEPEHPSVIRQDYLTLDTKQFKDNQVHVIGNPPFGRQSAKAIKFIQMSATYAQTISFILPRSFKKQSLQRHFPPRFHLKYEQDMGENSFIINGNPYNVPCVFQIWVRGGIDREIPNKQTPCHGWEFVKKDQHPDISLRRVGVNAGSMSKDISDKCEQSHYFIKFTDTYIKTRILGSIFEFSEKENTVGPRSIGKQEVIREFNKVLAN